MLPRQQWPGERTIASELKTSLLTMLPGGISRSKNNPTPGLLKTILSLSETALEAAGARIWPGRRTWQGFFWIRGSKNNCENRGPSARAVAP
jgi:hypothetical protein